MNVRRDILFWTAIFAALLVLLWLLSGVLLPFVLGMAIAYVVDPVVVWLERHRLTRGAAAGILVGSSFVIGIVTTLVVGPVIVAQAGSLLARIPEIVVASYHLVAPALQRLLEVVGADPGEDVRPALLAAGQRVEGVLATWVTGLVTQGLALANIVGLLSVTPLVAFYLLRDWPRLIAEVDGWLPRDYAETIRMQAREADRVLAGFARGAALVCTLGAGFYGIALSVAGLDFGLVIGIIAGALSFVPYLGAVVGFGMSVGMALIQFWPNVPRIVLVGAIFVLGNVVSDYVITPRVVGDRIGVHPLWVLFGFFAGAALFGFVGMLVSVPACAVIGVGARFAIGQYKASAFYRGTN